MNGTRIGELIAYAVMGILAVGGGILVINEAPGFVCRSWGVFCPPAPGEVELGAHIDEYLAAAGPAVDAETYMSGVGSIPVTSVQHPHRDGRVAVVNVVDRKIDSRLARALPADIIATRPEDVASVVWVSWGEDHIGTYHVGGSTSSSGEAYRGYCNAVIVDIATGSIVSETHFDAPPPPQTTTAVGSIHTEVSTATVVSWLASLPLEIPAPVTPSLAPSAPPTTAVTPIPSLEPSPELSPLVSMTLRGRQSNARPDDPAYVNDESFDLVGGEYKVVFSGDAALPYGSNVMVRFVADFTYSSGEEGPTYHFIDEIADGRGPWKFTAVDNILPMDAGPYHLELTMPKGPWTITVTRR